MTTVDQIIELVESKGFYRANAADDTAYTLWTCDEWKDWYGDPRDPAKPRTGRCHTLMDTVAQIIGAESGYKSLTFQPEGCVSGGEDVWVPKDQS